MVLVSYTIALHDNLITVFSGITHFNFTWTHMSTSQTLTIIAVLIAIPSLWLKDLSAISFLSSAGILMSCLIFGMVACTALFGGFKADQYIPVLRLQNIPAVSGIYVFSFAGHVIVPKIYKDMKDPSLYIKVCIVSFDQVCIVSFAVVTSIYTSLGLNLNGSQNVRSNHQLSDHSSMPQHLIFTKIAPWATVLTPLTKYALELAPVVMPLERYLPLSMNSSKTRMF
ncbi:hypothetical protein QQ045_009118 [Rhodiola kirilowii]